MGLSKQERHALTRRRGPGGKGWRGSRMGVSGGHGEDSLPHLITALRVAPPPGGWQAVALTNVTACPV